MCTTHLQLCFFGGKWGIFARIVTSPYHNVILDSLYYEHIHYHVPDDLDVAPDFFEYFLATYPILRADPTLWCVSAWNDNGETAEIYSFIIFIQCGVE